MNDLRQRIHDDSNGLDYVLVGDYYIPDLILDKPKEEPEEQRSIGKWGRMHKEYLKECRPVVYNNLLLSGRLWAYLADLNEQAQARLEVIIDQMKDTEGVTEDLKRRDYWKRPLVSLGGKSGAHIKTLRVGAPWWGWVQHMENIQNRAEEIIRAEMIYQ
ncbi:MAG: TnpV protein [Clostridiales bacterium]|nr:TnpV protein [Clostridiales bacterium]